MKPSLIKAIDTAWLNQYLSKEELDNLQFLKLNNILHHAYKNCPLYTKKFDSVGFHPDQFSKLKDLEKVPFLTKQEIRDNLDVITATNLPPERRETVNTGGTTGVPMKFYRDRDTIDWMNALYFRTTRMYGCSVGSKTAWIWGLKKEDEYLDFRNVDFKTMFMKNTIWYNGFDMNPESMREFSDFSWNYKPELLISYVSSLFEYAKFLEKTGNKFHPPNAIWLTAEPVNDFQRRKIEEIFGCPTFSQYGASEILHMSTECSAHEGLHVHADSRLIEITDEKGKVLDPNESGFITVTDLENYVMPIIRYKNDDVASYMEGACSCGNQFPRLHDIMGRVYNVFKLRSGKQIYGHMFSRKLFSFVEEIRQFQIHQTDYDTIIVYLVPGKIGDRKMLEKELLAYFSHYTGEEVSYCFNYVNHIKRERSGKLLYTKSDV